MRWIAGVTIFLVILGTATFWLVRIHLRRERERALVVEWSKAYDVAFDSYKRVAEYKGSGVMWFEPRVRDYDTAIDALKREPLIDGGKEKIVHLETCENYVLLYRQFSDDVDDNTRKAKEAAEQASLDYQRYGRSVGDLGKKLANGYIKAADIGLAALKDQAYEIDYCIEHGQVDPKAVAAAAAKYEKN